MTFKKYVKTAVPGSEEALVAKKMAEMIDKFNLLLIKLDTDHAGEVAAVIDSELDVNYSSSLKVEKMDKELINSPKGV